MNSTLEANYPGRARNTGLLAHADDHWSEPPTKEGDRAGFMSHMIALWGNSTVAAEESVA
jgi:hypothetical protein